MEVVDEYETRNLIKSIFYPNDTSLVAGCRVTAVDNRSLQHVLLDWEEKERATLITLGYIQDNANGSWYRKEPLHYIGTK